MEWRIFLEHMAFKGTSRRSAFQIASEIENVGGEINAATSVETTSYYARVLADDVPLAVDILADILTRIQIRSRRSWSASSTSSCRRSAPPTTRLMTSSSTSSPKLPTGNQTIGRSILGTPETVKSFTSQQTPRLHQPAVRRRATWWSSPPATSSTTSFVREVEKQLGGFRPKSESTVPDLPRSISAATTARNRDLMDAQIILGFEGRAYHVRDFYASQVLSMILGGGMSSRLFQEVREKRGLCYSVYAFHWGFSDTGIFGVHSATGQSDICKLMPVIMDELAESRRTASQQDELNRARAQYRAGLIMSGESARQPRLADRPPASAVRPADRQGRTDGTAFGADHRASSPTFRLAPVFHHAHGDAAVGPVGKLASYDADPRRAPRTGDEPAPNARSDRGQQCLRSRSSGATLLSLKGERVTLRMPAIERLSRMGGTSRPKAAVSRAVGAELGRRRAGKIRPGATGCRRYREDFDRGTAIAFLHLRERNPEGCSAA